MMNEGLRTSSEFLEVVVFGRSWPRRFELRGHSD